MARETLPDLAYQLSALLSELGAAIQARAPELGRQETSERLETAQPNSGLRDVVRATLRWFSRPAARQPTVGRTRSARARSRRSTRGRS